MTASSLRAFAGAALILALAVPAFASAADERPWLDPKLSADRRAELALGAMTQDEKIALTHGQFPRIMGRLPADAILAAGYIPGVSRLGLPPLLETDAGLGVANAGRQNDEATALPSGLAIAASWDPNVAEAGGVLLGRQARRKGFNVVLAGGANLVRDPFNGRNFEYAGEDPLLAGVTAGATIRGVQSQHLISTAKHLVLNAQETGRHVLDARISEAALRESDLLAFQIALEQGEPGSVMCAYNKLNGVYACENAHLLNDVLKGDWGWRGWVMSDWGAVHSMGAAVAGLDQQSGAQLDKEVYFDKPLRAALASGVVPAARLDDMARRILRTMFAKGVVDHPPERQALDLAADTLAAQHAAEAGIVLLKNEGALLPAAAGAARIAVIGGHADKGVLSGGGSSQVIPQGSFKLPPPAGTPRWLDGLYYHPGAPLDAIARRSAAVVFDDGTDLARAAELAKDADLVVIFAGQWTTEGMDAALHLSPDQEQLITEVARASQRVVVVLETGGPILMPWLKEVPAVLQAWYPGSGGGEAIARILFGEVDPSGRLPVTFAADPSQSPRAEPVGLATARQESFGPDRGPPGIVAYSEGASVGYRWFAQTGAKPLFPFGHGLSYTQFVYRDLRLEGAAGLSASVEVSNRGARPGQDTVQLYLRSAPARTQQRLLGWVKVELKPGETRRVRIDVDPRLLADWSQATGDWRVAKGRYDVFVGPSAGEAALEARIVLKPRALKP